MDTNQTGLTTQPLCERLSPGDERPTHGRIDCYLSNARYLRSDAMMQLLATLWQKLEIGFSRVVISLRSAVAKPSDRATNDFGDHNSPAQQSPE